MEIMTTPNQDLVDKFFDAYVKRDFAAIKEVMAADVTWSFLGRHRLAGIKKGIDEVVAFFDAMGEIMGESNPTIEKVMVCSKDNYFMGCQHIKTNRADGNNIDHHVCVLWTIENGKITSGMHFFADPPAVDEYFNAVEP